MATTAIKPLVSRYSSVDKAYPIAYALLKTAGPGQARNPLIRDIAGYLYRLLEQGIRFRNLGLRGIPGGYYSEDVEAFVGHLLSMGYAVQRSPIKLTPGGEEFCEKVLAEETDASPAELAGLRDAIDAVVSAGLRP